MKALTIILTIFIALWIIVWVVQKYQENRKDKLKYYDWLYRYMDGILDVSDNNSYDYDLKNMNRLERATPKSDRERTSVMWSKFRNKYGKYLSEQALREHEKKMK